MRFTTLITLACTAASTSVTLGSNPNPDWDADWETSEQQFLSDYVQLTSEQDFIKAGESYFSHDGKFIIFQGIPVPEEGEEPDEYYSMYVAQVARNKEKQITGLMLVSRISEPGSSSTCGWFHPTERNTVLFGTTTTAPATEEVPGFQRGTSKYSWQFPREMEIVRGTLGLTMKSDDAKDADEDEDASKDTDGGMSIEDFEFTLQDAAPMWERDGYDAEGSWSSDGRYVLYTRLEPGGTDGDIWLYDSQSGKHTPMITEEGYDGGPFFSPDMKSICYRSDRNGDQLLQIFVAFLDTDDEGTITGIKQEVAITDNEHVNWCPFFTVDAKYLLYATSELGHGNYEIFCVDASGDYDADQVPRMRVTNARGFDGLPAFSRDGAYMIWTAQRGEYREGEDRPSSQLWAAKLDLLALHWAYEAERTKLLGDEEPMDEFKQYDPNAQP